MNISLKGAASCSASESKSSPSSSDKCSQKLCWIVPPLRFKKKVVPHRIWTWVVAQFSILLWCNFFFVCELLQDSLEKCSQKKFRKGAPLRAKALWCNILGIWKNCKRQNKWWFSRRPKKSETDRNWRKRTIIGWSVTWIVHHSAMHLSGAILLWFNFFCMWIVARFIWEQFSNG